MEDKKLILIMAIIVIAIAAVGVLLIASQNSVEKKEYTTHALSNSLTIEVPVSSDVSESSDDYGIRYYIDRKNVG